MAFREQGGLDIGLRAMAFLEGHADCVYAWTSGVDEWRRNGYSVGRTLGRLPRRLEAFRDACARWARRGPGPVSRRVPSDFVFVTLRDKTLVRIAVFRYRADITKALREYAVHEVMES
jgi:hypothetical protein